MALRLLLVETTDDLLEPEDVLMQTGWVTRVACLMNRKGAKMPDFSECEDEVQEMLDWLADTMDEEAARHLVKMADQDVGHVEQRGICKNPACLLCR